MKKMIKSTVAFTWHSAIQIQDQIDLVQRSNSKEVVQRKSLFNFKRIRRQKMVHKKGSQL